MEPCNGSLISVDVVEIDYEWGMLHPNLGAICS